MTTKHAVVVQHLAFEDLGTLAPVLTQRGYQITYLQAGVDPLQNLPSESPDLLVLLGGPIGVYQQQDYPFLADELNLLKSRFEQDLPVLGICLGAQLMAHALGAQVYPGKRGKELGWSPIFISEAGQHTGLTHLAAGPILHWHGDTFDLPQDCVHLASSTPYLNQAFSYRNNSLALQFHPEVTVSGMERWLIGHVGEIEATPGVTVEQLRQDTQAFGAQLQQNAALFWQDWLNHIEASAPNRLPMAQVG